MVRSQLPRNVKPSLSDDPVDKLYACLNCQTRQGSEVYQRHPLYYEACREWHETLGEDWQGFVIHVLDAWHKKGEKHAKELAARLPPAPLCPL